MNGIIMLFVYAAIMILATVTMTKKEKNVVNFCVGSRSEHEEFCKRIDAENGRQNKRLELLEGNTKQINSLTTSVEKLAQSIQLMCKEQEQQGARLESLESRDGEMWKQVTGYVLTTLIGLAIGFFFKQFGL